MIALALACVSEEPAGKPRRDVPADTTYPTTEDTDGDADTDTDTGCPAPPADLVEVVLPDGYGHPTAVLLLSGQVGAIPLAEIPADHASEAIVYSESPAAGSPQPVLVEVSIHRCKGVIDADETNFCNLRSQNGFYNGITYLGHPYQTLDDYESANALGYCWAPVEDGPWYANARWTYEACAYDMATCGFFAQRNLGPY
ncbi:MAG: hypothetical protein ACOZNI_08420 [Myxococcota bacterium]